LLRPFSGVAAIFRFVFVGLVAMAPLCTAAIVPHHWITSSARASSLAEW
jgi:hypothetical protein